MTQDDSDASLRATAVAILERVPIDRSRRASFGSEQRTEHVLVAWRSGQSRRLEQAQDDRISFALRDHFESARPDCRTQLQRLRAVLGEPDAVTVAWSYQATWEGTPPLDQTGRWQFAWSEVVAVLRLEDSAGGH